MLKGFSRDHFVKRVLKEDAFKPVAEVPCRLLSRARTRFIDVALFSKDLHWQPTKQLGRRREREMRRVIGKRPNLVRHSDRSQARVHASRHAVKRMVNVHREIEQPSGRENSYELPNDAHWRLRMIHHVVANNHVETPVEEWQRFANGRDRLRSTLPTGKQTTVINR